MKKLYSIGVASAICLAWMTAPARAQENTPPPAAERNFSKVGVGMGNFLNIPVGARAVGMGGGFAGVADDPTALYWNAAGIMQQKGASASYSFMAMFADIAHNFAGVTFPIGESYKGGISAITYGSGDIERTTLFDQDGTGENYQVRDLVLGLSLAGQLTDQFAFGFTGKFVNLAIADITANGVAFDVSTMYKPGFLGLRLGFAVQNLSSPLKYTGNSLVMTGGFNQTTNNQNADVQLEAIEGSLPLTFRAGLSTNIFEGDKEQSLIVGSEFSTASDRGEFLSLGAEYVWNDLIAARVGYQFGTNEAFSLGGGLGVRYQTGSFLGQIDYAIRPHKTLGLVNQVTATVRFD